jgi:hypothetical protein
MGSIGPTGQTQDIIDKLAALKQKIKAKAIAAVPQIEQEVQSALGTLYPPKLADIWQVASVQTPPDSLVLAQLDVCGEDKRVRGYEFGTPPHAIDPKDKQALAFESQNQQIVVRHVNHPGTKPHDKRDEVVAAIDTAAKTNWQKAINDALLEVQ